MINLIRNVFAAFGVYCLFTTVRAVVREDRQTAYMKELIKSIPDIENFDVETVLHEIIQEAMDHDFKSITTPEARDFVNERLRIKIAQLT
jgi:hypothetical protein